MTVTDANESTYIPRTIAKYRHLAAGEIPAAKGLLAVFPNQESFREFIDDNRMKTDRFIDIARDYNIIGSIGCSSYRPCSYIWVFRLCRSLAALEWPRPT